jgi:hypothetical protein
MEGDHGIPSNHSPPGTAEGNFHRSERNERSEKLGVKIKAQGNQPGSRRFFDAGCLSTFVPYVALAAFVAVKILSLP